VLQKVLPQSEAAPIPGAAGASSVDTILAGLHHTLRDMERKARDLEVSNAKLKELDRLKSDFLASVSHELRTPLTSIRSFSEILLDYPDEAPDTRERFLRIINNESARLTNLINNVLDLAKIESGRISWNMAACKLEDVLERAVEASQGLAQSRGIILRTQTASDLHELSADADRIQQVAINLIGNALKFSTEGKLVEVTAGEDPRDPQHQWFAVQDQGPGTPLDQQHRIFEKFEQLKDPDGPKPVGSGLGLAISKEIVETHGGWIEVDCPPPPPRAIVSGNRTQRGRG
jgi:signal transduction histidine kinase